MYEHVVIIGAGLMGGSLGLAMKQLRLAGSITAVNRRNDSGEEAVRLGIADAVVTDIVDAAPANLYVIATPLGAYPEIFKTLAEHASEQSLMLDAGSVKGWVIQQAQQHLPPALLPNFVACHPIAGSADSGPTAADADLYRSKKVIICPHAKQAGQALILVENFWQAVGAETQTLEAEQHDVAYAHVSHLPQLLVWAFVEAYMDEIPNSEDWQKLLRLGGSNVEMWADIFATNSVALRQAAEAFLAKVTENGDAANVAGLSVLRQTLIDVCEPYRPFAGRAYEELGTLAIPDHGPDTLVTLLQTLENWLPQLSESAIRPAVETARLKHERWVGQQSVH